MTNKKKLFLLDAMALIYRAYFAFQKNPRITSKGLNTSAILGFANTLIEILKNEQPTHIGVAFDTKVPTFRHEEFAEYKAHREEMPEALSISIPYIIKIIEAFNIPILSVDGFEADDVIGTLAKQAEREGFITYMMTPDKDFGQLVSENIFIYRPGRNGEKADILGIKEVCEKFGVKNPLQVIDILGLQGDVSDNIPGIPGIGEKRAKELIVEFGSIENLLKNTNKLKGKMRENIEQFSSQGILSKKLATIMLDVPIAFDENSLKLESPNIQAVNNLFEELEFKTLAARFFADAKKEVTENNNSFGDLFSGTREEDIKEIQQSKNKDLSTTAVNYHLVETSAQRSTLIKILESAKMICFDTETTGLDPNTSELVGISFAIKPAEAWFVPVPSNYDNALEIVSEFKHLFEDETIEKTGQNLKYDISVLKWYEVEVKGKLFDTMIAHYLIEPDLRHNMDFLAETYLNYKTISYDELTEKSRGKQLNMRDALNIKPSDVTNYACEDADITLQLRLCLEPKLSERNVKKLFEEVEIPLIPVLTAMETEGVNLDIPALNDYSAELEREIQILDSDIHAEAGGIEFNIGSPKQLGEILFDHLKIIDKPKTTKTGQYSTGEDILAKLVNNHPIVEKILDYRSLTKLKSTYVDALPLLINPRTGRIHTSYNQAVASTGRLSSNNPNIQNIPIRTERGREIRKAFIPRNEQFKLLSADYSQIELRIIAELSGDSAMQEAFRKGLDIHTATASKVYNVNIDEVNTEMRRNAKTVNFGIVYGISAFGLSERLNIPRSEAKFIIDQYFEKYSGIKTYMEQSIEFAHKNGYVETILGRRRYLRDINSSNATVRQFAERNAINAPIQGSAADMIKIAMINIYRKITKEKLRSKMILQVHDELVFDADKEELEILIPLVREHMVNAIQLNVPVEVEISSGANWLEAH